MPDREEAVKRTSVNPFPVLLTFDLDAETLWTARDPDNARRPITLSQGSYGPKTGLPRVLDLLKRYQISATFFIPGQTIERYPEAAVEIHRAGHEIGHHSYSHKWLDDMPEDEERREFDLGISLIKEVTGQAPSGYRSPAAEFSPNTMRLLLEYGFRYSSNFFDRDSPYRHLVAGKRTDLVELPFAWVLDDAPFFLYSVRLPGRVMSPPSAVAEHWIAEFDGLYAEEGTAYVLAMHPEIIGRPSRIPLLERFIQHALAKDHVWIGRCDTWVERIRDDL